jgi:apolipoprotein N-acyltransferase
MKKTLNLFKIFVPNKKAFYALLFGAFAIVAYAPLSISAAILISLAGVFWLWYQAESKLDAMKIGLWFGFGFFGAGVSWLISSMYVYSGMSIWLSLLATFGFVLFLSLYLMLAGWLVHYFYNPKKLAYSIAFMMPVVWVLFEMIRASLFTGFPFLLVGNTHLFTWLDGYAPVFGVLAVSLAVAFTAGILLYMFVAKNWLVPSLFVFLIWITAGFLNDVQWVEKQDAPVDIALVQANVSQDKKWLASELIPTLKTYVGLTKQHIDADVIVWAETSIPAYFNQVKNTHLKQFLEDAKLLDKDILMGAVTRDKQTGDYYNAIVNAQNTSLEYRKKHLVPFSEFFPFSDLFRLLTQLFDIPFSEFSAGNENQQPMLLADKQVGLSICYEMYFGAELAQGIGNTSYLITVSNDAWFAHTLEPYQLRQETQMRALELGREIARGTNTGLTVLIGIDGAIKAEIPAYKTGVLRTKIQSYTGKTPFAEWKNMPVWLFLVIAMLLLAWQKYNLASRKT